MAFQSDLAFAKFLRNETRSAIVGESAPAVNFLLEERLPRLREVGFLATAGVTPAGWDVASWRETFKNHYFEKIALPQDRAGAMATFSTENQENHFDQEIQQDVVRLESIRALHERNQTVFDTSADLAAELRLLVASRTPGTAASFSSDQRSRLSLWLDGLNLNRDARPAFAAPFGEVKDVLSLPDWATQLRNIHGLSHFEGSSVKPLPVVLCQYNLTRVEQAARKHKVPAWTAVPTVLEAGGWSGPGSAFFPFPKKAQRNGAFGFGVTVDLSTTKKVDFMSEFLHFRLDYVLEDFVMVGEITDSVTDAQLAAARKRHLTLLEGHFRYRDDLPSP